MKAMKGSGVVGEHTKDGDRVVRSDLATATRATTAKRIKLLVRERAWRRMNWEGATTASQTRTARGASFDPRRSNGDQIKKSL